jgi:hypothetical protein
LGVSGNLRHALASEGLCRRLMGHRFRADRACVLLARLHVGFATDRTIWNREPLESETSAMRTFGVQQASRAQIPAGRVLASMRSHSLTPLLVV